jgi:hypothetical protein
MRRINPSLEEYFGPIERGTVEDVSPEESTYESEPPRLAGLLEVTHLVHIASLKWQQAWNGEIGRSLKEPLMQGVFFQNFAYGSFQMRSTSAALTYALIYLPPLITIYRRLYRGNQQWPFHVITKCEAIPDEKERFRKFKPRSDLLVSKSNLPRLLVEVNSKPRQNWPEDLVQMLLTGAAVVRLANRFLDRRFMAAKNFVLCAIYVWDAGEVSRYLLSEELYNPVVCWTSFITKLAG